MKKLTNEKFIEKAKSVHCDKFDYSLVEYNGFDKKIKIICPKHGIFEQTPRCHLKHDCFRCSKEKFLSDKNDFITKAIKKHNNIYDYSLVEYKNSRHKVKIICSKHGIFEQNAQNHLNGQGCPICFGSKKNNTIEFIKNAKIIHGDKYDYSLVKYENRSKNIKIICPEHGVFEQMPYVHLRGSICYKCFAKNKCESTEDFIIRSKKIHYDKYDYSLVDYKNVTSNVKIICPKHGIFLQTPSSHLRGYGCQICKNSKGEEKIFDYLKNNNIKFEREKRFIDCRDILPLPFDFYIPSHNICIEFDGIQHFRQNTYFFKTNLVDVQKHDNIKNIYCKENNISLYRFNYKELNKIEKKLNNIFK